MATTTCRWPMLAQSCTAPTVLKPKSELPYALRVSPRRRRLRYSRKPSQRPQQDRRRASGRRLRSAHGAQTQTTTDSHAKRQSASMPPMQQRRQHAGGWHWPEPCTAPTVLKQQSEVTCTRSGGQRRCRRYSSGVHAGGRHWPDPAQHPRCLNHMQKLINAAQTRNHNCLVR